jgi:hypothetical protein
VPCDEKNRLLDLYKSQVANYSATITDLNITRGKTSQVEYDRLAVLSDEAWKAADSARLELERHSNKHGC